MQGRCEVVGGEVHVVEAVAVGAVNVGWEVAFEEVEEFV